MILFTSVGLPLVFVIIMSGMEGVIEPVAWRVRLMKVAWDGCVLAFGVMGHIFVNPNPITDGYSPQELVAMVLGNVAVVMAAVVILAYLRKGTPTGWKVIASLAISGAALGLPRYWAFGR